MIPAEEVARLGVGLLPGQRRRAPHDCGAGAPMQVSRESNVIRAWCHRCADGGSFRIEESYAERVERLRKMAVGDVECRGPEFPSPAIRDMDLWPPAARVWLYRAGLSRADIGALGIYYHPNSDRVVIPVGETFYQARAYPVPGREQAFPKYLGPRERPPTLIPSWGTGPEIVLCEDLLSAIKVGQVTEAWCVLGVRLSEHMLGTILRRQAPVLTWLDPDPPGQAGARTIQSTLRRYGVPVRNIVSARDPKLHHRAEIQDYIANATSNTQENAK